MRKVRNYLLLGLVLVLVGGGYVVGRFSQTKSEDGQAKEIAGLQATASPSALGEEEGPLSDSLWEEIIKGAAATKGEMGAEVVIVEFSDYQCPFCARYVAETLGQLDSNYIKTGKVTYIFHDMPLPFHQNAFKAAEAARCAGDQGKYWEYHDGLFKRQDEFSSGEVSTFWVDLAKELGLSASTFSDCLDKGKHRDEVVADSSLAQKAGVNGTPTFFVNKQKIVGAQPLANFQTLIESALVSQ